MWFWGRNKNKALVFDAATVSDRGLVRLDNQDACFADAANGAFGVADGMGGGEGGALASRWLCDAFTLAAETFSGVPAEKRCEIVEDILQRTNKRIRAYAREKGFRTMGSTAVLALFDAAQRRLHAIHVGDSRLYRLRRRVLERLTRDHTMGDELTRLSQLGVSRSRDFASRRNPLTHILTRAVGTEMNVRAECHAHAVCPGDRYLLCTDGVHDMLGDDEVARLLARRAAPRVRAEEFAGAIRAAGAADNFTFVLVDVS